MWETVPYVSTGITLVAFLAAVIAWVLKSRLRERERLIRAAPETERGHLVRSTLEFFDINPTGPTKEQQFRLSLQQIQARGQRFKITAAVICFLAIIGAGVTVYAIALHGHDQDRINVTETKAVDSTLVGFWETMVPTDGQERHLHFQFGASGDFSRQYFWDNAGVVDASANILIGNTPLEKWRYTVKDTNSLVLSREDEPSGFVRQLILMYGNLFEFKRVGAIEDQENLLVGKWTGSVVYEGATLETTIEVGRDRKYRSRTEARDEGRIKASNNRYEIISRWTTRPIEGTYTLLSPTKLSLNIYPFQQITLQRRR